MTIAADIARALARNERWSIQDQTNDAIRRMIRAGATFEDVRKRYHVTLSAYERLKGHNQ